MCMWLPSLFEVVELGGTRACRSGPRPTSRPPTHPSGHQGLLCKMRVDFSTAQSPMALSLPHPAWGSSWAGHEAGTATLLLLGRELGVLYFF